MREITPQPGFTALEVEGVMESGQYVYTDCFTIYPLQGDALRYTTYQRDISVLPLDGGATRQLFYGNRLLIKGLRVNASVGIEVDEQELNLDYTNDLYFQNQLSWAQALLLGRLDGATIRRDRFIANSNRVWMGGFPMFRGLVSTLKTVGRASATMNVKSDLVLLNVQMPRDLWEANCKNTLGDPICGINLEDYAVLGTVGSGSTRNYLVWSGVSSDYALGKIHIANGDSTTRVRTISRVDGSGIYLSYPLDFDPEDGLSFTAYPGCDRTMDRCPFFHPTDWQKFFKGFPYIPVAETAVG